jgi:O-antigen/teichoic acid export membrane protein
MGYSKTFKKGVSLTFGLRVVTRLIAIGKIIILARILSPVQFGIFGIASLLLSFLEILTEIGINVFLVQQKGDIKEYINAAFVISIARGIILSLLIILLAPFVASFFNAADAYSTILLISIVPFIRGFINPAIVSYQKDLLFQKEVSLRLFLFSIDAIITIFLALMTKSAQSFVWGLIISALCEVMLSYWLFSLKPKFELEFKKIKQVIRRGTWVTFTGIFAYFADNGGNIAVGRLVGTESLGIYQVAYKFSTLPISEITNVVNQVVFPIYTKFSDDLSRLSRAFIKVTAVTSIAAILLGGAIFLFAEQILLITLGSEWILALPVIKILAIYGILRTIFGGFSALFFSLGRQDYVAKMTFIRVLGLAILLVPMVSFYGMVGAGYAMLFSILVEIPVALFFASRVFKVKMW